MKRILSTIALVLFVGMGFAQDKAVKAEVYGFIRNYFTYDSRSCVQSNEGLFNMLPNDVNYGTNGEDLNAIPSVRFLSMTTRLGLNVTGPEIWGAKSTAKIESDFCGASSGTAFNLRIRQAYAKLAWEKSDVLVGQAWHPMSGDLMPEVFSLATGAPFNPFNRSPQVRYNYAPIKGLSFTAAALYQYQYGSVGLDGKTANTYSRNALVPELFIGMTAKGKLLTGGFGVNASTIAPRVTADVYEAEKRIGAKRVDERLTSLSAMVFGSLKVENLSIRTKAVYGQNTSHMQQPTGFGIVSVDDNGVYTYESMQLGSAWITMMYGKKLRYGFFAGWMKNFGSAGANFITNSVIGKDKDGKDVYMIAVDGKIPGSALVARNNITYKDNTAGLDQAFRFSPIVTYKVKNMQIGLEYEHTAAAYGTYKLNMNEFPKKYTDGTVTDTRWVGNNRVCMMLKYDF